jgi:hypothetical protein
MQRNFLYQAVFVCFFMANIFQGFAQVMNWQENHRGSFYLSIGYGFTGFGASSIHITQSIHNSDYTLNNVAGSDIGDGDFMASPNRLRFNLGYYFNHNQNDGIELSYDPCKYFVNDNQKLQATGTLNGMPVSAPVVFSSASGDKYNLSGGSIIMVNLVKRFGVYRKITHKCAIDILLKAGVGPVMPSAKYSYNDANYAPVSSFAGINFGGSLTGRLILYKHIIMDLTYKVGYAQLSNISINDGTASQTLLSNDVSLCLGYAFPITRYNPLFANGWPHHREIKKPKPMYKKEEDY